ncbi:ABC-2 type transport system permease protein [Paenibacillus forsythiae]|uniref:ABC-2 type transport system permease protein n=3 Tax=Paenibacillus forsythiae TaxID=365616 RepID=A0ABU3HCC9_9BACL|nr:ABC transporter permease [Paenibacillus forsythiae]MDT3428470.1 ABC-2 type transport system permease protein [Paenibacillus forsythiae]
MNNLAERRTGYDTPDPGRLLRMRLVQHWKEQLGIIRTAADWTVFLYILIPGALLGGRYYYGFWKEPLPAWIHLLPYAVLPALLALLMQGGMLLLLHEGDLLFLRQRKEWIRTIMLGGILYSLSVTVLKIAAGFLILLPFLVRGYGLSESGAGALLVLSLCCGTCIKLLAHNVRVQKQGWRRWLWLLLAAWLPSGLYIRAAIAWSAHPALLLLAAAVYAAVAAAGLRARLVLRGTFLGDVREDFKQRMKIAGLLLRGVIDKPRPTRHKPWIFRKSQTLLRFGSPESRLAGASIKAFIRNPGHFKLYLQFSGVSAAAILIVPGMLKWAVCIVMVFLMASWLVSYWKVFAGEEFIALLPFTKERKADAGSLAVPILLLPFSLLCAAVASILLYGWWGLAVFIPAGAAIGIMAARVFTAFRLAR